jgi:hypothetical protein
VGFERTIPVFERVKTVPVLDDAATVIGTAMNTWNDLLSDELEMVCKEAVVA